jgi:4-alpha-glucanotransferase
MGILLERATDVEDELRARRLAHWKRPLDPVSVAWNGRLSRVPLRLPTRLAGAKLAFRVELEGSGPHEGAPRVVTASRADVEGRSYAELLVSWQRRLPPGYHRLHVRAGKTEAQTMVISAPARMTSTGPNPTWGAFLPLYALRSDRSWGIGDLTDLGDLAEWVGGLGGGIVATLPVAAGFLDELFDRSPYSPASRLFWNEVHLDVTRIPEVSQSPRARAMLASPALRGKIDALQRAALVDHRQAMALKRIVLKALAESFFHDSEPSPRRNAFEAFVRANPAARDYARFRAACERHRRPWFEWPSREREGRLEKHGDDPSTSYHLYVQWLADEQMAETSDRAHRAGAGLYFDFPLGVNLAAYDAWREREAFVLGASAGAPPDSFFVSGQNWGFPPLHPEGIREQGYRYLIACLRHLLRHARVLRIDHVMGLHRLFWIPSGMDATKGVYVRYRWAELYAVLALESAYTRTVVVGEDLGTVPGYVRKSMAKHGLYRTYVMPNALTSNPRKAVTPPPRDSLAGLNTHDMAPFAGFWREEDIKVRLERGWLDEGAARDEHTRRLMQRRALVEYLRRTGRLPVGRTPSDRQIVEACLDELAAGPARMLVVNLEDLWAETEPQNVPGTVDEYPNWRRAARYTFQEFSRMPRVTRTLSRIDTLRRGGRRDGSP